MAELKDPRFNLSFGWDLGETEWKSGMDFNLVKIGALWALSVKNRTLSVPPTTPAEGDLHIISPALATGGWTGRENQVAYWHAGIWKFYPPRLNWAARIEAEGNCLLVWNGTIWDSAVQMAEGSVVHTGTVAGTVYGAAATNLLSLWGAVPITQPAGAAQAAITPATATLLETATLAQALQEALVAAGIIKGAV